jgi:hypothetical protein
MQIEPPGLPIGKASVPPLSTEISRILSDLKIRVGSLLEAKVNQVTPLTPDEQKQLMDFYSQSSSVNRSQGQLQQLIRRPNPMLMELNINNKILHTLSDLPLVEDQVIKVLVTPKGLVLIPTPPAPSKSATQTPLVPVNPPKAPTLHTSTEFGARTPASTRSDSVQHPFMPPAATQPNGLPSSRQIFSPPTAQTAQQQLLAITAAHDLPKAEKLAPLMNAAKLINLQLTKETLIHLPRLLPLKLLLGRLPAQGLDLARLTPTNTQPLKAALHQSGVFYESRVKQAIEGPITRTQSHLRSTPTGAEVRDTQGLVTVADKDTKGLLLQAQTLLTTLSNNIAASSSTKIPDTIAQLFLGFMSMLTPRQLQTNAPPTQQLIQALKDRVDRSLAGIQIQQCRTLNSQTADSANPQWHLDVPLRSPEGYGNLYLHFSEQKIPDQASDDTKPKSKRQTKSRWRVFLELELDELGKLAAEISAVEHTVGITLWAEQDFLREKASAQLQELKGDLEKQGITIEELRCSPNLPPTQKVQLDYALIDTQT